MSASSRALAGDLTSVTVPGLAPLAPETQTIDLSAVGRTDTAGLALLVTWLAVAEKRNQPLHLAGLPAQLRQLVQVNGLAELFGAHSG